MEDAKNKTNYIVIIIVAVAIALGAYYTIHKKTPIMNNPAPVVHDDWETSANADLGLSFNHPTDLRTSYITPTDWPPVLSIDATSFSCNEAGLEIQQAGQTKREMIAGHTYCVTRESEGAAGSTYTNYAYARAAGNTTEILTFSLRFVQCGNYDEPNKTACESERQAFDIGPTIDQVFATITKN